MWPALRRAGPLVCAVALLITLSRGAGAQTTWLPVADGYPRTPAELGGFHEHTSYAEMWDYLERLRAVGPDMRLGSYGETREARRLAYAVFGRPLPGDPADALVSGRPVVVLAANVHGDERTLRESLLILMRDFATPGTEPYELLDRVTVVVAPQLNPDGSEASEGGRRGNAWGVDLNRDYIKLEQPGLAAYVRNILGAWHPQLFVDGHDGGSPPYNLTYQCPSLADADPALTRICDEEIFPAIDRRLEAEGLRSWYYVGGDEQEWTTGGYQARIGRNYGGLINVVGLLLEAPRQGPEQGVRAGYLGYLTVVRYAAEHADRLMGVVQEARSRTIDMGSRPSGDVPVSMEYAAEDELVDYTLLRGSGAPGEPADTIDVTGARLVKKPVATKLRTRPWAYVLPREAVNAVRLLQRHGILVERLDRAAFVEVEAYTVAAVTHHADLDHPAVTEVTVGDVLTRRLELPSGTYVVPTGQALGRLVAHMLEVETDDNVVYWNRMEAWLPRPGEPAGADPPLVPIYKLMHPTPLAMSVAGG